MPKTACGGKDHCAIEDIHERTGKLLHLSGQCSVTWHPGLFLGCLCVQVLSRMIEAESAQPAARPLWALPPPLTGVVDRQSKQACRKISHNTGRLGFKSRNSSIQLRKINQIKYIYIYIGSVYLINTVFLSTACLELLWKLSYLYLEIIFVWYIDILGHTIILTKICVLLKYFASRSGEQIPSAVYNRTIKCSM